jgi:peptidoglycan/LPS O-acetylase OafA/YrhL
MSTEPSSAVATRVAEAPATPRAAEERVHYLDWLRVLALLGVFVYHTMRPFDTMDWHVKNAEQSEAVTILLVSLFWGLALFFLLAGAASALALRWRSARQYAGERLLRLAVPLVTAYLLLSPVQAFIQETHFRRYHGSLLAGLPLFFRAEWANLRQGPDLPLIGQSPYHLWFLIFLLWFSLLGLPLLVLLRRPGGRRLVDWLGQHSNRRGAVLLWAVPLALVHAALRAPGPGEHGWGEFLFFFDFFVAGAVVLADQRLVGAVRRDLLPALWLALAATMLLTVGAVMGVFDQWFGDPSYSWSNAGIDLALTVWAWAWVLVALAWGMRVARFQRPLPAEVGAAAMPFFLVHQPVILTAAFFVVQWDASIALKLPTVLSSSLVVSAALAVGLSKLPYVSTLFGVKHRRRDHVRAGV